MSGINPLSEAYRKLRDEMMAELKEKHKKAFDFYNQPADDGNYRPSSSGSLPRSRQSLDPVEGNLTDDQLRHLLRRTRMGARKEECDHFKGQNVDAIVERLLQETELSIPLNYYNEIENDDMVPTGTTFVNAGFNTDRIESLRIFSLKVWMLQHMMKDELSIHPTMWFFWHNILVTQIMDVFYSYGGYRYLKLLHDDAMGNYKKLIQDITTDANMLIYLNGARNVKQAPDENYARELQELFCIGKGPDAAFTESDVQEAARVLTGHTFAEYGDDPQFYPPLHDTGDKQFSAFYNNKVIKGKVGHEGKHEYIELIDMIMENAETAKYICRRLYTFFVFSEIDEWTENNIITELADTFRDNDYEIKPVLSKLFKSQHFYDELNYGAIVKNPTEFILHNLHQLKMPQSFDNGTKELIYYYSILWAGAEIGLNMGDPPSVSGWPAYYQVPLYDRSWITTTTITSRIERMDALVWWGFWTEYGKEEWDALAFTRTLDKPELPDELINEMVAIFLPAPLSEEVHTSLKNILLSGQQSDYYWTGVWQEYLGGSEEAENTVFIRLRSFYHQFFQLPQMQLK